MKVSSFVSTQILFKNVEYLRQMLSNEVTEGTILICSEHLVDEFKLRDLLLNRKSKNFLWIKRPTGYPDIHQVSQLLHKNRQFPAKQIIAIGGGSCIDLAKVISLFFYDEKLEQMEYSHFVENIKNKGYVSNKQIPVIAIPTTAGTGAEITRWATIWDRELGMKYSVETEELYPKQAIIIPELTYNLSKELTLSTTLDTFSHSCEAYWSKASNPLVRGIAYRSMEIILRNLEKVLNNHEDNKARNQLCTASVLAAVAFSQTRTTACHSISYPLTLQYGIEHGLAVAITLAKIYEKNKGHFEEEQELGELFASVGGIQNWIDRVTEGKLLLRNWGITKEKLPQLANASITKGRMDNNPVELTKRDVEEILTTLL